MHKPPQRMTDVIYDTQGAWEEIVRLRAEVQDEKQRTADALKLCFNYGATMGLLVRLLVQTTRYVNFAHNLPELEQTLTEVDQFLHPKSEQTDQVPDEPT